jgi:hypothetical protein
MPRPKTCCDGLVVLTPSQRVSLAVCKDFTRAKLKDLNPTEKEYLIQKIRDSAQKEGLPILDDEGIEWRVSKVLPELRHYQRCTHIYIMQHDLVLIGSQLQISTKLGRRWLGERSLM